MQTIGELTEFTVVGCYARTGTHCLTARLHFGEDLSGMPAKLAAKARDARAAFLKSEAGR